MPSYKAGAVNFNYKIIFWSSDKFTSKANRTCIGPPNPITKTKEYLFILYSRQIFLFVRSMYVSLGRQCLDLLKYRCFCNWRSNDYIFPIFFWIPSKKQSTMRCHDYCTDVPGIGFTNSKADSRAWRELTGVKLQPLIANKDTFDSIELERRNSILSNTKKLLQFEIAVSL